jgi:hypothetical protein
LIEVTAAKQSLYEQQQQHQRTPYIVPHEHNGPRSPPTTPHQSKQVTNYNYIRFMNNNFLD